jgi:hypothetical protein
LYTVRPGFKSGASHGLTVGLLGAYGSFTFYAVESDEPTDTTVTVNGETTYYDVFLGEFVAGYTLNLLSHGKSNAIDFGTWGLGLPLGVGFNRLENQVVLETGLQLRILLVEIRGTYRTIGFRDNSFTISVGGCIGR